MGGWWGKRGGLGWGEKRGMGREEGRGGRYGETVGEIGDTDWGWGGDRGEEPGSHVGPAP